MKNLAISLAMSLVTVSSFAHSFTAVVGVRNNHTVISKNDSSTAKSKTGFQAGVLIALPLYDSTFFSFRTGGLIATRDAKKTNDTLQVDIERKQTSLDIPLTFQFGNDFIKGYAGATAAFRISSSCTASGFPNCTIEDNRNGVVIPVVGFDINVVNMFTAGAYYEVASEFSKDWKQDGYGLNLGYTF